MLGVSVRVSVGANATAPRRLVAVRRLMFLSTVTPPGSNGARSSQPPPFLVNAVRLTPIRSSISGVDAEAPTDQLRSGEHTSELQSLMRNSYAVFCLKKNNHTQNKQRVIQN